MNQKAPEVAERSSKRKCLQMGRSSEKLARRSGAEAIVLLATCVRTRLVLERA